MPESLTSSRPVAGGEMPAPVPIGLSGLPLKGERVAVLAQAPLDQSPRMVAQAWMLAEAGAEVRFVAFGNAENFPVHHPRIHLHAVTGAGRDTTGRTYWPFLRSVTRTFSMTHRLRRTLQEAAEGAGLLLAQVPPIIPGAWLASRLDLPLALDWHNLSAPMAALKLGPHHPALGLLERFETALGRRARCHFAVTDVLAEHLAQRLDTTVHTLPDRPLSVTRSMTSNPLPPPTDGRIWRTVVCPTSWSPDEAMDLLLDAAEQTHIPQGYGLRLIATGKGPLRTPFEQRAATLRRDDLRIETAWLASAEYHALLAHADAGVSLHRSASGLDFPMKIVDMEAAGLPVLALDYGPALRTGLAGLAQAATFTGAGELAVLLEHLINGDVATRPAPRSGDWPSCWTQAALPALTELLR